MRNRAAIGSAIRLAGAFVMALLAACTMPETRSDTVRTMRVNGYDLAYLESGSGTPVVLIHGSLNDYRAWEPQMKPFAARYRVIALSLRHHYPERWDGRGDDYNIRQQANDVAAFIQQLDAGKVHLIAHSRGGNVGLHVGKQHPELLRTLVLADASGLEGLLPRTPAGEAEAEGGNRARKLLTERLRHGEIDRGLAEYATFTTGPGAWDQMSELQKQVRRDNAWTIVADTDRPRTGCDEGSKITVPVLLVNGELSPARYRKMFDIFQGCIADRERVIIPGASHGMFRTHTQATNAAVLAFLDRH